MSMRYTTPEQAKRLEKLGLDLDTADLMYYQTPSDVTDPKNGYANSGVIMLDRITKFTNHKKWMQDAYNGYNGPVPVYFDPCWSTTALMDILAENCERFEISLRPDKKYSVYADKNGWVTNKPFLDCLVDEVCEMLENRKHT